MIDSSCCHCITVRAIGQIPEALSTLLVSAAVNGVREMQGRKVGKPVHSASSYGMAILYSNICLHVDALPSKRAKSPQMNSLPSRILSAMSNPVAKCDNRASTTNPYTKINCQGVLAYLKHH